MLIKSFLDKNLLENNWFVKTSVKLLTKGTSFVIYVVVIASYSTCYCIVYIPYMLFVTFCILVVAAIAFFNSKFCFLFWCMLFF